MALLRALALVWAGTALAYAQNYSVGGVVVPMATLVQLGPASLAAPLTSGGAYAGISLATGLIGGNVNLTSSGIVPCLFENATTPGDLVVFGTGIFNDCRDSGQTLNSAIPAGTRVLGAVSNAVAAGAVGTVVLGRPDQYGTLNSGGGSGTLAPIADKSVLANNSGAPASPGALSVVALTPILGLGVNVMNYGDGATNSIRLALAALAGSPNTAVIPALYPGTELLAGSSTATATVGSNGLNINIVGTPALTASGQHVIDLRWGAPYTVDVNCTGDLPTLGGFSVCALQNYNRYASAVVGGVPQEYINQATANNVYGGGINYNGYGGQFTTTFANFQFKHNIWTSGIDSNVNIANTKLGLGDSIVQQLAGTCFSGVNAGADEGCKLHNNEITQGAGQFSALVSGSLAPGATSIPYVLPSNNGYAGEGHWLIDYSNTVTGSISAVANNTAGPTSVTYSVATGSVGASSVVGVTATAVPSSALNTPFVVTFGAFSVGSAGGITTSTLLCVGDVGDMEYVVPTAVTGTASFTAVFTRPKYAGAIFAAGGACGSALDVKADDQNLASFTGLGGGAYTSGISAATGPIGSTCQLSGFNNGNQRGVATVALTALNTPPSSGAPLTFIQPGVGSTGPATAAATIGNGTATGCSGASAVVAATTVSPNINNISGTLQYPIPVMYSDATHFYLYTVGAGQWLSLTGTGALSQWSAGNGAYTLYPAAQVYSVEKDAGGNHTGGYSSVLTVGPNNIATAADDLIAVTPYFVQRVYDGYNITTNFRPQAFGTALLSADFYGLGNAQLNLLALTNHTLISNYIPGGGLFRAPGGISIAGEIYRGISFLTAPDEYWLRAIACPAAGCGTLLLIGVPNALPGGGGDSISYTGALAGQSFNFSAAVQATGYATAANCVSGASPAVCGAAPDGAVAIPTGTNPTLTINTTAVTLASRIWLTVDAGDNVAATTCNGTLATLFGAIAITTRTPGASFTIAYNGTIAANPLCLSYKIEN